MGIALAGFRPRRGLGGPISVVFSQIVGDRTNLATWQVVLPDPGSLLVGDVVVSNVSINNGIFDSPVPESIGWTLIGSVSQIGNSRNYSSQTFARRVASAGSLSLADRTFKFFTNFINSESAASIIVLRGVRNSGVITADFGGIAHSTITFPDPPAAVRPSPVSISRGGAGRLAISFGHVDAGTLGPSAPGWTRLSQQSYTGLNGTGQAYCEAQYFPSLGTTSQVAPTPSPIAQGYGLVHAIAP